MLLVGDGPFIFKVLEIESGFGSQGFVAPETIDGGLDTGGGFNRGNAPDFGDIPDGQDGVDDV
jgi:hypothetical protein